MRFFTSQWDPKIAQKYIQHRLAAKYIIDQLYQYPMPSIFSAAWPKDDKPNAKKILSFYLKSSQWFWPRGDSGRCLLNTGERQKHAGQNFPGQGYRTRSYRARQQTVQSQMPLQKNVGRNRIGYWQRKVTALHPSAHTFKKNRAICNATDHVWATCITLALPSFQPTSTWRNGQLPCWNKRFEWYFQLYCTK